MNKKNKKDIILDSQNLLKLFSDGVENAIKENKALNIPSIFTINEKIIFQMPDNSIKTKYDYNKQIKNKIK